MRYKALRYVLRRIDGIIFGTVSIPSNDVFNVVFQTNKSRFFVDCAFLCTTFDWRSLGCVWICLIDDSVSFGRACSKATFVGISTVVYALAP